MNAPRMIAPTGDRSVRNIARLLALVFFVFVGLGGYAYHLHDTLQTTNASIARMQAETEKFQADAQASEMAANTSKASVQQCTAQIEGLRSQVEAATAEPPQPVKATPKVRTRS